MGPPGPVTGFPLPVLNGQLQRQRKYKGAAITNVDKRKPAQKAEIKTALQLMYT
jgi:hypothetical protein